MTDQPYTPTTEQVRLAHAESVTFHVMEEPELTEANNMFDRWYVAEIAAAEQRGAIKALRDAAGAIEKNNIVFDGDHYQPCNSCMSIHMNWLDYRADLLEGDE